MGIMNSKTVLVTGASKNIGRAIAVRMAREEADLVVVGRQPSRDLDETVVICTHYGVKCILAFADVSNSYEVDQMIGRVFDEVGDVDVLVSTTGVRPHRPFWEVTNEEWNHVLAVNLYSTFYLARALAPSIIDRRSGSIVAIGRMSTVTAGTNRAAVAASKAA
jgi:3-oxoacyl-[acyl-carrier protein] reductase